jgi:hypothetical protein
MGLTLHRNLLRGASIVVFLASFALHRHALCKLSLAWLGVQVELSVQKGPLLVESRAPLVVGAVVARSWLRF